MSGSGRKGARLLAGVAVVAALVLVPFYAPQYTVSTLVRIIYFGFLALSVGLLIGQGGMISLTQTAFFGLAGYVVGLLGRERGLPFPVPELSAMVAVVVLAMIFALVVMRTHRIVFLMITLALGQICWSFARQNSSLLHGWAGIRGIRPFPLAGIDFTQGSFFYWMALALFLAGLLVMALLVRSPFGLVLKGIRENPVRMKALGYPVYWVRVTVFVIAALYAGIGGIIAVYATGIVTPTTIQLSRTIWVLLVVILGGANYFWGPVVGTVIAVWLDVIISQVTPRYNTVIGIIFVAVVLLTPNGIMGLLDRMARALRAGRARRAAVERREGGGENHVNRVS
jgi:branched-chain amino acid transport system permease protein